MKSVDGMMYYLVCMYMGCNIENEPIAGRGVS